MKERKCLEVTWGNDPSFEKVVELTKEEKMLDMEDLGGLAYQIVDDTMIEFSESCVIRTHSLNLGWKIVWRS
mgnify:CR=1 FL=1